MKCGRWGGEAEAGGGAPGPGTAPPRDSVPTGGLGAGVLGTRYPTDPGRGWRT